MRGTLALAAVVILFAAGGLLLLGADKRVRQEALPAFSAHDTSDFHAEALAAGCNEYVTKPIDFDELESLLQKLLRRE